MRGTCMDTAAHSDLASDGMSDGLSVCMSNGMSVCISNGMSACVYSSSSLHILKTFSFLTKVASSTADTVQRETFVLLLNNAGVHL